MTADWTKPQAVDALTVAFPASVCGTLLPPMDDIPEEFKRRQGNIWCDFISHLFFAGGTFPDVKAGIDAQHAISHMMAVLRSFEPKHEHKTAGAAWLMSMWYQQPQTPCQ